MNYEHCKLCFILLLFLCFSLLINLYIVCLLLLLIDQTIIIGKLKERVKFFTIYFFNNSLDHPKLSFCKSKLSNIKHTLVNDLNSKIRIK
jgi:hypothetical protein